MKAAILTDTTKCIGCQRVRGRLQEGRTIWRRTFPAAGMLDDGLSARNWTSIVEGPQQTLCAQAVPPLPGAGLRLRLPGRRPAQDRDRRGGLRQRQVHGLPLLHDGLPLRHSALRLGRLPCPTSANAFSATTASRRAASRPARKRARPRQPSSATATSFSPKRTAASARIPALYLNKVWGEQDVGGTSVLYISNVDLSFLSDEASAWAPRLCPQRTARGHGRRAVCLLPVCWR